MYLLPAGLEGLVPELVQLAVCAVAVVVGLACHGILCLCEWGAQCIQGRSGYGIAIEIEVAS